MRRTTEPNSKTPTHHFPFFFFFYGKARCPRQRESIYRRGRRDDDTSMVLSTAVTSPEAEERDVKMTSRFSATGSKPTGPPAPSRPTLLCLGHEVPNNKKRKAA